SNAADVPALSQPRSFSWARDLHAFGVKSLHLRKTGGEGRFGQETRPRSRTGSRLGSLRVSAVSFFTAEARRPQRGFAVGAFATDRKQGWIRPISSPFVATSQKSGLDGVRCPDYKASDEIRHLQRNLPGLEAGRHLRLRRQGR